MPLSRSDALRGAAYQVIFEKVNNPDRATTREALTGVVSTISLIEQWAKTQPQDVRAAYESAAKQVARRANDVFENNQRRRQMIEARQTIPTPP